MRIVIIAFIMLALIACSGKQNAPASRTLQTFQDSVSYSIGRKMGGDLRKMYVEVDSAMYQIGFNDGYFNRENLLDDKTWVETMQAYQVRHSRTAPERAKAEREVNKFAGDTFRDENAEREGVVVLSSGLQYKILSEGDGDIPKLSDRVQVQYTGKLLNGLVFDSSYKRGEPTEYAVNSTIAGWREALTMMPMGSQWELYIPPELAYGVTGTGYGVPPNATLIFQVDLGGIK